MRFPFRRPWLCLAVAVVALLAAPGSSAEAQSMPLLSAPRDSVLRALRPLGVDSLTESVDGVRVPAYFTPGYRARAAGIARLLAEESAFYADSLGVRADLQVAVLDSAQWTALTGQPPYGVQYVAVKSGTVFLPATRGGALAREYLKLEGTLAPEVRAALRRRGTSGTSWPAAVDTMIDLIGYHEVGHAFAQAYGIGHAANWFDEFVGSYMAYAFMRARHPALAEIWDLVGGDAEAAGHRPTHRTLAGFEALYLRVGIPDYIWYQAEFIRQNRRVYDRAGLDFVRALRARFPAGTPRQPPAAVLAQLERITPGFVQWARVFEPQR